LKRKNLPFQQFNGFIKFSYPIAEKPYTFIIDENSSDSEVFNQIMVLQEYKRVIDLISQHRIEINTIIDAGANVGYTTVYLSHFFENAQIISLEPNESTMERLKLNVELNGLKNVHPHRKGLWNKNTFLKANHTFRDKQAWSFRLEETSNESEKLFEVTSINSLMEAHQLEGIDFLKIDVEGGEKDIFSSEADVSWLKTVKVIAIEIHDEFDCRDDIEAILREQFTLFYSGELTIGIHQSCIK
jgi:FkbM family methyltransferase